MSNSDSAPQFQAACPNLRSKEMYHQAPGPDDDQFSSGLFWCARTQESFGPDGQPVSKGDCCNGRQCFGS